MPVSCSPRSSFRPARRLGAGQSREGVPVRVSHRNGVLRAAGLHRPEAYAAVRRPDSGREWTVEHQSRLMITLLSIPSSVMDEALDYVPEARTPTADEVLNLFFAGAHFAHREWIGATLTRGLEIFQDAATDRRWWPTVSIAIWLPGSRRRTALPSRSCCAAALGSRPPRSCLSRRAVLSGRPRLAAAVPGCRDRRRPRRAGR